MKEPEEQLKSVKCAESAGKIGDKEKKQADKSVQNSLITQNRTAIKDRVKHRQEHGK